MFSSTATLKAVGLFYGVEVLGERDFVDAQLDNDDALCPPRSFMFDQDVAMRGLDVSIYVSASEVVLPSRDSFLFHSTVEGGFDGQDQKPKVFGVFELVFIV